MLAARTSSPGRFQALGVMAKGQLERFHPQNPDFIPPVALGSSASSLPLPLLFPQPTGRQNAPPVAKPSWAHLNPSPDPTWVLESPTEPLPGTAGDTEHCPRCLNAPCVGAFRVGWEQLVPQSVFGVSETQANRMWHAGVHYMLWCIL